MPALVLVVVLARVDDADIADEGGPEAPSAAPELGCLKTPKLMDFFCGCTLHAMLWLGLPFTQRTRYDLTASCQLLDFTKRIKSTWSYLAVYHKLL